MDPLAQTPAQPEKATPEMYEAQIPVVLPPKKRSNKVLITVLIVLVGLLASLTLFFLVTRTNRAGIVDPSGLKSQCLGGTKLTWWLADTAQTQPANYAEIIANYNLSRGAKGAVAIETVVRKYDQYDYYTNLLNAMAKNAGPDIVAMRNDDLPGYRDYLLPLATFDSKKVAEYKRDFVDLVGQETVLGDKLYGVATYVDNLQLYYNKELLDQNSVPRAATTWAELQSQARTLSKSKDRGFSLSTISLGIGSQNGLGGNITYSQEIIPMLVAQYGGTIYDNKTNTIGFQIAEGATKTAFGDAVQFYNKFSDNTAEEYSWDEFMGNNVDEFLQNRLVYLIGYKELDQTLKTRRPDLDFQVTNLPQINESAKKTFGKYFVNVMARTLGTETQVASEINVKRACAEEFLTYMTTLPAQQSYISQTLMPSAHRTILDDQVKPSGDQKIRVFAQGSLIATNYYKPNVIETEKIWGDLVTLARAKKDINSALSEATTKYNTIVGAGPVIRQK